MRITGTPAAEYASIGYAKGQSPNAGVRAESAATVTAGKYITVGLKFMRGLKDTPEFLKLDDYVQSIEQAAQWKVVLSDVSSRQHWLADGASVILHLCRAYLSGKYTKLNLKDSTTLERSDKPSGPAASFDVLTRTQNRAAPLYPGSVKGESKLAMAQGSDVAPEQLLFSNQWFLFEHQATLFYHWLEQIHDRIVLARTSSDIDLSWLGSKSIGFEFRDLLSGRRNLEPRSIELSDGAKVWLPYARSVDAIHLHASNLGSLLRPMTTKCQQQARCGQENAAPAGEDYLMAPLSVLREDIDRLEHTATCAQLAKDMYWKISDEMFSPCQCKHSGASARCKAIIRKLHSKPSDSATADLPTIFQTHPNAAIIIGNETQTLKQYFPTRPKPKRKHSGDDQRGEQQGNSTPGLLSADSGYISRVVSRSSNGGQASNMKARTPSDGDTTVAGAAKEPAQQPSKRRKLEDFFKRKSRPAQ